VTTGVRSGWIGNSIGSLYRYTTKMEYNGTKGGTPAGQVTCHAEKMVSRLEEIMAHIRAWRKQMKTNLEATKSIQKRWKQLQKK
jgi:hypothetical protein